MNKPTTYILILIFVFLVFIYFVKPSGADQKLESEQRQKEYHKSQAQLLDKIAKERKDSLDLAFETIKSLNLQTQAANKTANTWRTRYQKAKNQVASLQPEIDSLAQKDTLVMVLNTAYKVCDSTVTAQQNELKAQGEELLASGAALKLSTDLNAALTLKANHLDSALVHLEKESILREKMGLKKGRRQGAAGVGVIGLILLVFAL